ncbi:MAG: hypothetical protein KAR87_02570 [Candidatus Aenigmarchaeota archaeon]|nr:hypothetical protein [Candidatus Aenigmarchaeota archaeon]
MKKNKITEETVLSEVLEYPNADQVLSKYKFPCLTCPMAAYEIGILKIGDVAKRYGIDIDACLEELNKECFKE